MFDYFLFLKTLTSRPGVYCMRDNAGKVLYIGKAKNLQSRLSSYFRPLEDPRIAQMVSQIGDIDVTVTNSEKEALLLENSLIKSLRPRYNVIFRDDKSYPYLFLSKGDYPRLVYFRGKQKFPGRYYGPYPSALAVKETLTILQKLFKIRQCDDTFFSHRSRPCLQYQIKRCSAPCVNYISVEDYAEEVENAAFFLEGKAAHIIENMVSKMENASKNQNFELAASLRDNITSLRRIFDQQIIFSKKGNADVIAAAQKRGHYCLHLLYIRRGQILDSKTFYPKQIGEGSLSQLLRGFIIQFYVGQENKLDYPHEIILNAEIEDQELIATTLSQTLDRKLVIHHARRGEKAKWLSLALQNAHLALERNSQSVSVAQRRWAELKKVVGIKNGLTRIECFDISHTQGEATLASCVVFDQNGPRKEEYRRYNIQGVQNDDYAALEQVITRRYLKRKANEEELPEVVMIDGGKGQLHCAKKAMFECQILDVLLIAIAKGIGRKPGLETLYLSRSQSEEEFTVKLPPMDQAFHLLQHIRDEAHRFAITGHRKKRGKTRTTSTLESIPGIGVKRRQKLLSYFGGLQGLMAASEEAIAQIPAIGPALAGKIYHALHGD